MTCPKCNSEDIRKIGYNNTKRGPKQRYQCHKGHTFYAPEDYAIKAEGQ